VSRTRAATQRTGRRIATLGLVLLVLYLAQAALAIEPAWVVALQHAELYRFGTGLVLAGYLFYQARLGARRVAEPVAAVVRHQLVGALAPLVLYLHASRPGYGYLAVLSSCYLGTMLVGLVHGRVIATRAKALFTCWFVIHVALSTLLIVFGLYHAIVALAYE
jgi:hypothetical protein